MGIELRKFPRLNAELKIEYEFVNWKEKDLSKLKHPIFTTTFDISASGIGLNKLEEITNGIHKDLETGKKKIKLGIYLNNGDPPLITFARLVWSSTSDDNFKYGFLFLDVKEEFFKEIKNFVDSGLVKEEKSSTITN